MMQIHHFLLLVVSFLLVAPSSILAIEYKVVNNVPNTPGGRRFDNELGVPYTIGIMKVTTLVIHTIFNQRSPTQQRKVTTVTTNITSLNDGNLAETGGDRVDDIYIHADGFDKYFPRDINKFKLEFVALMYHEMTHILQWRGRGTAPGWLTEGVAEWVRLRTRFFHPENFVKPGQGKTYKEGYGVTARFLEYCDSLRDGFTPELNNMMSEVYKEDYFRVLLGKPLDQLWTEYKHKYGDLQ